MGLPVMKERQERSAVDLGHLALANVGDAREEQLGWGNAAGVHVVHVRRPVRPDEEGLLPASFLACPAIDGAGRTRPLRWKP